MAEVRPDIPGAIGSGLMVLLGAGAATINPAVDLWLKLRGKAGPIAQPRGGAPA